MFKKIIVNPLLIFAIFFALLLYFASSTMMPFILGATLAYIINPIVNILANRVKLSRSIVIALIIGSVSLAIILIIIIFLPYIYLQLVTLYQTTKNQNWYSIQQKIIIHLNNYIPSYFIGIVEDKINSIPQQMLRYSGNIAEYMIQSTSIMFSIIINVALTPVIAYYIIKDYVRIFQFFYVKFSINNRRNITIWIAKIHRILKDFIIGQTAIAVFWGVYYGIAYWLIGIKLWLTLAIIAFIASFIPYIGALISVVFSTIIIMIQFNGISNELWYGIAVYAAGHILDVSILSNHFVGKRLGLHPLITIFSLLFSAEFLGIIGMLFALPCAVFISMIIDAIFHFTERKKVLTKI